MLDVRITGYVVPLAEQPQASFTPVISVENVADEDARITGLIRIYRDSTGLLIYDSELAVTQLEHHSSTNIAALTPFDPPAPADDDYFVKADLVATSYLPGPPLRVTFGAWHFDIKTPPMGDAPAGHHGTHEEDGSDEIEAGDLGTTEMDDSLVLAPDGAGGVAWSAAAAIPEGLLRVSRLRSTIGTDFTSQSMSDDLSFRFRATGSAAAVDVPDTSAFGVVSLNTAAGANNYICVLASPSSIRFGGGVWTYESRVRIVTLSDGSETFTVRAGFGDHGYPTEHRDGAFFRYIHSENGGNWTAVCRANNVETSADTGIAAVAGTWYVLRVVVNAAASSVAFYIDGTLRATIITNIPSGAGRETGASVSMVKSVGTTARVLLADWLIIDFNPTASR